MRTLLFFGSLVGLAVTWALHQMATIDLRAQLDVTHQSIAEVAELKRERDRLLRLHREAHDRVRSEDAAAAPARPPQEVVHESLEPRSAISTLTAGEWLPIREWKNRGQATVTATVETALWAAAGGDVEILKDLLQLDDSVRAKADAVLAHLPEASRAMYPSAEHLIAAFTTKSVPLGDVQLVWHHQPGPDDAVACVFVKNAEANLASASTTPLPEALPSKVPPMAQPNHKTIATYLSLRRTEDRWRLVVPLTAIEKIAKELGSAK